MGIFGGPLFCLLQQVERKVRKEAEALCPFWNSRSHLSRLASLFFDATTFMQGLTTSYPNCTVICRFMWSWTRDKALTLVFLIFSITGWSRMCLKSSPVFLAHLWSTCVSTDYIRKYDSTLPLGRSAEFPKATTSLLIAYVQVTVGFNVCTASTDERLFIWVSTHTFLGIRNIINLTWKKNWLPLLLCWWQHSLCCILSM